MRKQLILALAIAVVSDVLSAVLFPLEIFYPLQLVIDLTTAVLLFVVTGWRWLLLPGLVAEAIPTLEVLPFWVLVVGAIAVEDKIVRRKTPIAEVHTPAVVGNVIRLDTSRQLPSEQHPG